MTAFEDVIIPRKRMATYGKAVRRRIPDYNFGSHSQASERKQNESLPSRSRSITPAESQLLNHIPRPSPSKTLSSAPPTKSNVFDVPSSDDEAAPPTPKQPAHIVAQRPAKESTQAVLTTKEALATLTGDMERRKRVKLSPAPSLLQKPNVVKPPARQQIHDATAQASKILQKTMGTGSSSTMATRPKKATMHRKLDVSRTPRKMSPQPKKTFLLSTPSPQLKAIPDMMDVDITESYISPRGLQLWKDLLDPLDASEMNDTPRQAYPGEGAGTGKVVGQAVKALYKPSGVTKQQQNVPKRLPRRRLIDSLVEQTAYQDGMEDDENTLDESTSMLQVDPEQGLSGAHDLPKSQNFSPELAPSPILPAIASQGSQIIGPKFTYSRQRSMLAEEDFMQQLALDMPEQPIQPNEGRRPRRSSIPALKSLQSFGEEEEGDDGAATGIRSVHELRQAGANNRFLDEIEDLLDRIGKPAPSKLSMRRSGLLDFASKIKDKNFIRQLRAKGVEQRLFVHLGQETDVISGFLMVSILIVVLVDASMPHIVLHLRRQGITRLLIRLVESQTSLLDLSKDRKSNMSKVAQTLLSEHLTFLLELPMWEDLRPQTASPRTVALKCLELMVRQTREAGNSGDIISKELTTNLFSILKAATEQSHWELPQGKKAIEFYLALSTLESHSIVARTVHDESIWISDYLPIISDTLEYALQQPADDFGPLQGLLLRLTLNVTNNNPKASNVFARASLMAIMGQVIVAKFKKILHFLTEEDFSVAVDHLVLVLGVMINFAEWSAPARESLQSLKGKDGDPLDDMVRLFMENKTRTSEAESVEESQRNVAFGYLSVLLGYLSLLPQVATRIAIQQPRKSLRPLVESIEEFIGHHKAADMLIEAAEDGHSAQTGLTERLENLVAGISGTKGNGK